jgi:hypothetical protein
MANFEEKEFNPSYVNSGKRFEYRDKVRPEDVNEIVEGGLYSNKVAKEASGKANDAFTKASEALGSAGNAVATAGNAVATAENAVATANNALTKATNAETSSTNAVNIAEEAKTMARGASATASAMADRVSAVSGVAHGAQTKAEEAYDLANRVKATASTAEATASTAEATASTALTKATEAQTTAENSLQKKPQSQIYYLGQGESIAIGWSGGNGKGFSLQEDGLRFNQAAGVISWEYAFGYIEYKPVVGDTCKFNFPTNKTGDQTFAMLSDLEGVGSGFYLHLVTVAINPDWNIINKIISTRNTAYTSGDEIAEDWGSGRIINFIHEIGKAKVIEYQDNKVYACSNGVISELPNATIIVSDEFSRL